MVGSEEPSNTWFLGSTQILNPNGISIRSAVFAQMTVEYAYTLQWAAPPPQIAPSHKRHVDCYLIHGSLGPPESSIQTAS